VKVREDGRVVNADALLATGVNADGHRKILAFPAPDRIRRPSVRAAAAPVRALAPAPACALHPAVSAAWNARSTTARDVDSTARPSTAQRAGAAPRAAGRQAGGSGGSAADADLHANSRCDQQGRHRCGMLCRHAVPRLRPDEPAGSRGSAAGDAHRVDQSDSPLRSHRSDTAPRRVGAAPTRSAARWALLCGRPVRLRAGVGTPWQSSPRERSCRSTPRRVWSARAGSPASRGYRRVRWSTRAPAQATCPP
jgi:hypothetical protein